MCSCFNPQLHEQKVCAICWRGAGEGRGLGGGGVCVSNANSSPTAKIMLLLIRDNNLMEKTPQGRNLFFAGTFES